MRGERRRENYALPVGGVLNDRIRALGFEAKIREYTAPIVWAELVGPQIAAATDADRVKDGILYVYTRSAMWSHELTFHKADILHRLNVRIGARAGEALIKDIRFQNRGVQRKARKAIEVAAPLHPSPDELDDVDLSASELAIIEHGIAVIADEELRARMRRLRIANARMQTWRLDNGWAPCPTCGDISPPAFNVSGDVECPRCRVIAAYPQRS